MEIGGGRTSSCSASRLLPDLWSHALQRVSTRVPLAMHAGARWPPKTKKPRQMARFVFGGGQTRTGEIRRWEIYSLLQLPLCDTPREKKGAIPLELKNLLAKGIEPSTIRLQVGRSTN